MIFLNAEGGSHCLSERCITSEVIKEWMVVMNGKINKLGSFWERNVKYMHISYCYVKLCFQTGNRATIER